MPKTGTLLLILAYLVAAAASWHRLAHSPEAAAFLTRYFEREDSPAKAGPTPLNPFHPCFAESRANRPIRANAWRRRRPRGASGLMPSSAIRTAKAASVVPPGLVTLRRSVRSRLARDPGQLARARHGGARELQSRAPRASPPRSRPRRGIRSAGTHRPGRCPTPPSPGSSKRLVGDPGDLARPPPSKRSAQRALRRRRRARSGRRRRCRGRSRRACSAWRGRSPRPRRGGARETPASCRRRSRGTPSRPRQSGDNPAAPRRAIAASPPARPRPARGASASAAGEA